MAHLDLVWPAVVLVVAIAGAIVLRMVAMQGDRASRARHRLRLDALRTSEAWQRSRDPDREEPPVDALTERESTMNPGRKGDPA